jgi:hypothetical protein
LDKNNRGRSLEELSEMGPTFELSFGRFGDAMRFFAEVFEKIQR